MIRGLYTACSGMLLQLAKQDVIANNLANASTPGFKKDLAVCTAFPDMMINRLGEVKVVAGKEEPIPPVAIGRLGTGAAIQTISTDFSAGAVQKTDNPLDLAIAGDGFFVIQTPQGEKYTRNGSFRIGDDGILTTAQGYPVLGRSGPINIGDQTFTIDEKGNLLVGDEVLDTLRVVRFENNSELVKTGDDLFTNQSGTPVDVEDGQVIQGYLELSNVVAVKEMVELISVLRAYEANQKIVQAHDQTLDAAINRVGAV
ncbi:MAG: flagellar basal-body rod protein FlgF [Syntrophothermus sp.]|uniref:flagellar basal-body rod protein FlgF n=1 Tax=Syntrophothermus sp. TaxID=2736299 RepID=UPI00257AC687|nr:flagellar basal-body rod protein FlgF [Syntrophothermus sp.]NSW82053.1 flagellar basal-body rod protein FlgF [Syntrophothermus sp.]